MQIKNLLLVFLGSALLFSCKKEDADLPETPTSGNLSAEAAKDTTVAYARDIYLWYDQIPSSFNGRSYNDPNAIMTAVRQYSVETGFSQPVDRWSFAVKQKEWDNVSSGIAGDFGLDVFFFGSSDLRVKSVEKDSPAGRAGVKRGWRITGINGSSNINTNNIDFIVTNIFEKSSGNFTFQKPDNSTATINLTAASYQKQPIALDSVYTIDNKKIGYIVFNSFLGDTTAIYNEFNRISNRFVSAGVSDVIVDLRYNGGGYVSVAEKFANYLVKPSANGQLMMKQEFNKKFTDWNTTDNFRKLGSLNLNRIYFIVSKSTASASELLINNLKPYMEVVLVGQTGTYGKPVGYFPIPVGDWYIFPVSFRTTNKNGEGSYFNGIPVNRQAADGLDKNWGDLAEASLASAVSHITNNLTAGGFANDENVRALNKTAQPDVRNGNLKLDEPSFKGAIDTRGYRR